MDVFLTWWAWAIFAVVLVILEMLAPAFVLLGFGVGAAGVSLLLLIAGPGVLGGSLAWIWVIFAILSLIAWIGLRQVFKGPAGQVKTFDHDIND